MPVHWSLCCCCMLPGRPTHKLIAIPSIAQSDCPASNSNPDITGVGTRVALYVSITWGLVMTRMLLPEEEDFRDVTRTAYITSTALCIAGRVSALSSQSTGISIVDGLCVTTMTSLVLVYACLSAVYWPRPNLEKAQQSSLPTGLSLFTAFLLHAALWTAFGFTLWSDLENFCGNAIVTTNNANCTVNPDSTADFWLFGQTVPVTSTSLRAGAMTFFAIGAFFSGVWFIWRVITFYWYYKKGKELFDSRANTPEEFIQMTDRQQLVDLANLPDVPPGAIIDEKRLKRLRILTSSWMYILILLCAAAFIYLIVTTEMIISINDQRGNTSVLSFGQILALALLLDQLFQSGTKVKEHLQRWYIRHRFPGRHTGDNDEMVGDKKQNQGGEVDEDTVVS